MPPDSPHPRASLYWLARIESRTGGRDRAIERLGEALDAGWTSPRILDDPELDSLRDDARFGALEGEVKERLQERD